MTRKVAISVPDELLNAVDMESRAARVSRSQVFAVAARDYLSNRRQENRIAAYVASYQQDPESADEEAGSDAFLMRALSDEQ